VQWNVSPIMIGNSLMANNIWWSSLFSHPLALSDIRGTKRLHKKSYYLNDLWDGPLIGWREGSQIKIMF